MFRIISLWIFSEDWLLFADEMPRFFLLRFKIRLGVTFYDQVLRFPGFLEDILEDFFEEGRFFRLFEWWRWPLIPINGFIFFELFKLYS